MVIRLVYKGTPFALLPGDLDAVGLENLLEGGSSIDAPIIVFPHHGGRPGTSDIPLFVSKLLGAACAETIIFSIGRGRHGTPRPELIQAIRKQVSDVRVACTQLSKHCAEKVPASHSSHFHPTHAHGHAKSSGCGGTFVYHFETGVLHPKVELHRQFIQVSAEKALCMKKDES